MLNSRIDAACSHALRTGQGRDTPGTLRPIPNTICAQASQDLNIIKADLLQVD